MTIVEPSDNQDERSPLKKDVEINASTSSAALATAPPPYTPIPIPSPNDIPSSQDIQSSQDVPRTNPQSNHVIVGFLPHPQSPIRRILGAFVVAWLILLLWSALLHSFMMVGNMPPKGHTTSHQWQPQKGIDDSGRILPIQYPPIQLPQTTG